MYLAALSHGGHALVYLLLLPTLLQEVGAVGIRAVGITERYVPDVVACVSFLAGREVISRALSEQWMATRKHVDEHTLARGVRPYDGNMLAIEAFKVNGLGQSPPLHACHSLLYTNYLLHLLLTIWLQNYT